MSVTLLCNMCCRNYAYSVISSDVHDFHTLLQFSRQLLEQMSSGIALCCDEFTSATLDQDELCFDMVLCYFVLDQIVAVGYAIMTTRSPDLSWQMRAVRVLPMFLVPALAALIYSTITRLTKMLDNRDQHTLEKLRTERQAKIDELKERTNYYTTQQLIQVHLLHYFVLYFVVHTNYIQPSPTFLGI